MKKTGFVLLLMTVCTALVFPANLVNTNKVQDQWEDIVDLRKDGGTTRIAAARQSFGIQSAPVMAEPVVTVQTGGNTVAVSVQNYSGSAFVEIYGARGSKQMFFEVYNNGFDVLSLSGLGAGEYKVRVTLGDAVYSGTINKGKYGNRK